MKTMSDYKFWFIVGSQKLYGPEVLETVASRAEEMAAKFNKSGKLPCEIIYKVTAKTPEEKQQKEEQTKATGVHVAKLAGVPKDVTKRANEILRSLERKSILGKKNQEKENKKIAEGQLDMYNYKLAEVAHEIDKINLNEMTPIDALNTLMKIKEKMS